MEDDFQTQVMTLNSSMNMSSVNRHISPYKYFFGFTSFLIALDLYILKMQCAFSGLSLKRVIGKILHDICVGFAVPNCLLCLFRILQEERRIEQFLLEQCFSLEQQLTQTQVKNIKISQ